MFQMDITEIICYFHFFIVGPLWDLIDAKHLVFLQTKCIYCICSDIAEFITWFTVISLSNVQAQFVSK